MSQPIDLYRIGQNIRKIRELHSFNQEHLADALGMSVKTYGKLENDPSCINLSQLKRISETLETPVSVLLNLDVQQLFQSNNIAAITGQGNNYTNDNTEKISQVYNSQIQSLKEEIAFLRKHILEKK